MLKTKPVIIMEMEPRLGRTKVPAANAARVIARPYRGLSRRLENRI